MKRAFVFGMMFPLACLLRFVIAPSARLWFGWRES